MHVLGFIENSDSDINLYFLKISTGDNTYLGFIDLVWISNAIFWVSIDIPHELR